jgi:hypothetical protein
MIPFALLFLIFWVFPKGAKFLIAAPIVGVSFGGLIWSGAAMICTTLITFSAFAWFVFGGIILAEVVAFITE